MPQSAPFGRRSRFPVGRTYICETGASWARKFQQLKAALSLRERENKPSERSITEGPPNFSDSQTAFWNATTSMYDAIMRGEGMFNRYSFEQYLGLAWTGDRYVSIANPRDWIPIDEMPEEEIQRLRSKQTEKEETQSRAPEETVFNPLQTSASAQLGMEGPVRTNTVERMNVEFVNIKRDIAELKEILRSLVIPEVGKLSPKKGEEEP